MQRLTRRHLGKRIFAALSSFLVISASSAAPKNNKKKPKKKAPAKKKNTKKAPNKKKPNTAQKQSALTFQTKRDYTYELSVFGNPKSNAKQPKLELILYKTSTATKSANSQTKVGTLYQTSSKINQVRKLRLPTGKYRIVFTGKGFTYQIAVTEKKTSEKGIPKYIARKRGAF